MLGSGFKQMYTNVYYSVWVWGTNPHTCILWKPAVKRRGSLKIKLSHIWVASIYHTCFFCICDIIQSSISKQHYKLHDIKEGNAILWIPFSLKNHEHGTVPIAMSLFIICFVALHGHRASYLKRLSARRIRWILHGLFGDAF